MPFWIGVELFFVISGFVIGKTAVFKNRPIGVREFALRRIFRIYPNLVLFLLVTFLINLVLLNLPQDDWGRRNLAISLDQFLQDSIRVFSGTLNPALERSYQNTVLWSLMIELQFYFVIGLSMWLLRKLSFIVRRRIFQGISAFFLTVLVCSRILSYFLDFNLVAPLNYMLQNKVDFLLAGLILSSFEWTFEFRNRLSAWIVITSVVVIISFSEPRYPINEGRILNSFSLVVVLCAFLYLLILSISGHAFNIDKKIPQFFEWLGDLSYSIFLFQFPIFTIFWYVINRFFPSIFFEFDGQLYSLLQMLICVPLTLIVSRYVYRNVEVRFMSFAKEINY
jgi:peptidoglycan/LPS O-acetylase OafA/YrhL